MLPQKDGTWNQSVPTCHATAWLNCEARRNRRDVWKACESPCKPCNELLSANRPTRGRLRVVSGSTLSALPPYKQDGLDPSNTRLCSHPQQVIMSGTYASDTPGPGPAKAQQVDLPYLAAQFPIAQSVNPWYQPTPVGHQHLNGEGPHPFSFCSNSQENIQLHQNRMAFWQPLPSSRLLFFSISLPYWHR